MDLSGSVSELGYADTVEKTNLLINKAIEIAHKNNKYIGLSIGAESKEALTHWLSKGIDFMSSNTDMQGIINNSQALLKRLKEIDKELPYSPIKNNK